MSLKVFDLQCENSHVFEGWFASADAYESQKAGGLLSCPVCDSSNVQRKLSAPRLNVGHLKRERLGPPAAAPSQPAQADTAERGTAAQAPQAASAQAGQLAHIQAEILRQVRKIIRDTENVGSQFAEESRRIHYGDSEDRPIRGTATPQEREELAEEGIAVVAIPDFLDDDRMQ